MDILFFCAVMYQHGIGSLAGRENTLRGSYELSFDPCPEPPLTGTQDAAVQFQIIGDSTDDQIKQGASAFSPKGIEDWKQLWR